MKKISKRPRKSRPKRRQGTVKTPNTLPAVQLLMPLREFVRAQLRDFVVSQGMVALAHMLEAERAEICGPAYARGQQGPQRAGSTMGPLVMGGRQVRVQRPRIRHEGSEVELPTWSEFANQDPLSERALEQMVVGVSTRKYKRSLEALPPELEESGHGKSSVSRRFVAATKTQLKKLLEKPLDTLSIVAIMIDGITVEDHVVIIAVGLDNDGKKHVLGLWEGATENTTSCQALLSDLISRGLSAGLSRLFVIDGAKALRKAIKNVFGKRAIVQRCQVHKRRNVLGHLPESLHASVGQLLSEAYGKHSHDVALRRLKQLASQLDDEHPSAARSLREGLEETLTVRKWQLGEALERTLSSTNVIENLNGGVRQLCARVRRWRGGTMILRWVATSVLEAEKKFHRIRGYRAMPKLVAHLNANNDLINKELDADQHVA